MIDFVAHFSRLRLTILQLAWSTTDGRDTYGLVVRIAEQAIASRIWAYFRHRESAREMAAAVQ